MKTITLVLILVFTFSGLVFGEAAVKVKKAPDLRIGVKICPCEKMNLPNPIGSIGIKHNGQMPILGSPPGARAGACENLHVEMFHGRIWGALMDCMGELMDPYMR